MLKLTERHGSPYYYLRGTVRGTSIDESTRIPLVNKVAANDYRINREKELLEESIHGKRLTTTFSQAALHYLENGGRQTYRLADIIEHFGTTKLSKIGLVEIEAGAIAVFPTMQPASRRAHYYTPLSAIFTHAFERGWCEKKTLEWPDINESIVRWLTKEEANRFIDEGHHIKPLLIFLFYTGARISEAMNLQLNDLDLDRRHVQFVGTKNVLGNGKIRSRGVPLHPRVVEALREMLAVHRPNGGDVFRRADGSEYPKHTRASDKIKVVFWRACERAGIENFRIHDTRHTWATWHYQANRDLGALQKLGGWSTIEMVLRYAHTNVDELSDTIGRL
ncbi:site-specific integrase [Bradyrhizobium sp. LTSP885]|uniref:tyrosine-type recombinase/integrase n=1 Tax=Bradyrhizobium sp. LTSP885 TaxID=1619232 RepID=UPI0005CB3A91|nr:site-specific integrase [Bradyrhizobium sp. LTSP885]